MVAFKLETVKVVVVLVMVTTPILKLDSGEDCHLVTLPLLLFNCKVVALVPLQTVVAPDIVPVMVLAEIVIVP